MILRNLNDFVQENKIFVDTKMGLVINYLLFFFWYAPVVMQNTFRTRPK